MEQQLGAGSSGAQGSLYPNTGSFWKYPSLLEAEPEAVEVKGAGRKPIAGGRWAGPSHAGATFLHGGWAPQWASRSCTPKHQAVDIHPTVHCTHTQATSSLPSHCTGSRTYFLLYS